MSCTPGMNRRDWLKLAGAASLGAWAGTAEAKHLWTKAKKNFRLGIFTNAYQKLPVAEATARIKADGFKSVVTRFNFADVRFDPAQPDWDAVKRVRACLDKNEIAVAGLYGYYNVVAPDPAVRRKGRQRMEFLLTNWKRFGSPNVSTETGTYNPKSDWLDAPENATEEAYQEFKREMEGLVKLAEKTGAVVSIEVFWGNVIGTIDRAERLFREVNSPALKLALDPSNYFRPEDLPRMKPMLEDIFRRLGPQAALAHAKDVRMSGDKQELPAAGLGVLDYPLYLRLLAQLDRPIDLLLEHLALDDVPRARDFVLGVMDKLP